jgi:hypothetical protein
MSDMFGIAEARKRATPPRESFVTMISREINEAWKDMRVAMDRQFVGQQFWIPIKVKPRQLLQRLCHESLFARLHDWEITRYPAQPCYYCEGRMEYYDRDEGVVECSCTAGWIPERWSYKCRRCGHYVSKP